MEAAATLTSANLKRRGDGGRPIAQLAVIGDDVAKFFRGGRRIAMLDDASWAQSFAAEMLRVAARRR